MPLRYKPFATEWTYTSTGGNYEDINGVTQSAAANVRRLNYDSGVAQGILIESSASDVLKRDHDTEAFQGGFKATIDYNVDTLSAGQVLFQADDDSEDNRISVVSESGGKLRLAVSVSASVTTADSTIDIDSGSQVVVDATSSDITLSVDGEVAVSTSVTNFPFSLLTRVRGGTDSSDSNHLGGTIARMQLEPNFVTDMVDILDEDGTDLLFEDDTVMQHG